MLRVVRADLDADGSELLKFLCPQCERLVELRDFRLEGTTLVVPCSACGNLAKVPGGADERPRSWAAAEPASRPAPSAPPVARPAPTASGERPALQLTSFPGTSNVVALRSPGADAIGAAAEASKADPFAVPDGRCPKCVAPRPPTGDACPQCGLVYAQFDASNVAPDPWLAKAWIALLADWGNEAKHAELRARAQAEQDLASVGRLYRLRLAAVPEDPYAQRGRDEVLRMALVPNAPLEPQSVATKPIDPKWKYVMVAVVLVASLLVLAFMARAMLAPE